jgi:hypothetical protein
MDRRASRDNLPLMAVLWLAGLPGVVAVVWLSLPAIAIDRPLPVPLWVVQIVSGAQTALLLALAVVLGVVTARKVGFRAPAFAALIGGESVALALRPQMLPGLLGGLVGAALLWGFGVLAPATIRELEAERHVPAAVRLLYGGITEELLVRWGLMSLITWMLWRLVHGGRGRVSAAVVLIAIFLSAVLFGAGHLPVMAALIGTMTPGIAAYVVSANAVFGCVAGWLYWRHGLESAMLAHVSAHALVLAAQRV